MIRRNILNSSPVRQVRTHPVRHCVPEGWGGESRRERKRKRERQARGQGPALRGGVGEERESDQGRGSGKLRGVSTSTVEKYTSLFFISSCVQSSRISNVGMSFTGDNKFARSKRHPTVVCPIMSDNEDGRTPASLRSTASESQASPAGQLPR